MGYRKASGPSLPLAVRMSSVLAACHKGTYTSAPLLLTEPCRFEGATSSNHLTRKPCLCRFTPMNCLLLVISCLFPCDSILSIVLTPSRNYNKHQGGEKVRTAEEVRRYNYEPPSVTKDFANRHETVQVRRYGYVPPCPPPRPVTSLQEGIKNRTEMDEPIRTV